MADVPCLQPEGHTAHTGSAPPQSPAACSQSAATPAVIKNNERKGGKNVDVVESVIPQLVQSEPLFKKITAMFRVCVTSKDKHIYNQRVDSQLW